MVEYLVVILEGVFAEELFKFLWVVLEFEGFCWYDKVVFVSKVFSKEVENHVATSTDVGRIHRHLAKEILEFWIKNRQGSQTIP